jgi:hypothetical protein
LPISDVAGRELRKLAGEGLLVKVGYGLYARAKRSVLSGKPIPSAPLIEMGYQVLRRLGHSPKPSQAALDYIEGRTMQVPASDRIAVSGGRLAPQLLLEDAEESGGQDPGFKSSSRAQ